MSSSSPAIEDGKLAAPYGSWKSPITADVVSGASKRLGGISVDGSGRLVYLESRPSESGRAVLVRGADEKSGDEPEDVMPKEFEVRTVCQEYGGGAFCVSGDIVLFSNYKDQRLYRQLIGAKDSSPSPITPDYGVFDKRFHRYITVREDHRKDTLNAITTIVGVDLEIYETQQSYWKAMVSMLFPKLTQRVKGLHGLNGVIRTCPGTSQNFGLASSQRMEKSVSGSVLLVTIPKLGNHPLNLNGLPKIESDNTVVPIFPLKAKFARPLWVLNY